MRKRTASKTASRALRLFLLVMSVIVRSSTPAVSQPMELGGLTNRGGSNDQGVLFSFDPATSAITKRVDFSTANSSHPGGSLLQASNGKLYGMTSNGGANGAGVIVEYDLSTGTYSKKIDLTTAGGSPPRGTLMEASNGKLYGLTFSGGANGMGTLFEYDVASNACVKTTPPFEVPLACVIPYSFPSLAFINERGVLTESSRKHGSSPL